MINSPSATWLAQQLPPALAIQQAVIRALYEDIGTGDVSTQWLPSQVAQAQVISREAAILAGSAWFEACFRTLDSAVQVQWFYPDGAHLLPDQPICTLTGQTSALLSAERCALNFLQTLSATATLTHRYATQIADLPCRLLDTRKTIPGLRQAQKYAVLCGGGHNHRQGLYDAILIKENHIMAVGGHIPTAVQRARQAYPHLPLEIEVETLEELKIALDMPVDRILLDNFSLPTLVKAVTLTQRKIPLEVSGNVTLENIRTIAETGVDYISAGALTKHIQAIDLSMRILPK